MDRFCRLLAAVALFTASMLLLGEVSGDPLPAPSAVTVRLRGGVTPKEGYVEVLYAGSWGTICDTLWGVKDATVICRQLDLGSPIRATVRSEFYKGTSSIFLMDGVACNGSETNIGFCPFRGWGVHSCDYWGVAGAVCEGSNNSTDTHSTGLGGGGIAGIVIAVFVVCVCLGACAKTKNVRRFIVTYEEI